MPRARLVWSTLQATATFGPLPRSLPYPAWRTGKSGARVPAHLSEPGSEANFFQAGLGYLLKHRPKKPHLKSHNGQHRGTYIVSKSYGGRAAFQPYWGKPAVRNDRGIEETSASFEVRSAPRCARFPQWHARTEPVAKDHSGNSRLQMGRHLVSCF